MAFLDNIKDRLGFGEAAEEEEFDEELYGDGYDAYSEEFDEYAPYDEGDYAEPLPVPDTSHSAGAGRRERRGEGRRGAPNLVSIEDVRNSTRIPDSLNRDPLPPRRQSNFGRNSVGRASDYALSGSESYGRRDDAAPAGYNEPYAASADAGTPPAGGEGLRPSDSYDPYRVYEAGSASSHRPSRSVSVISPVEYGEVENVARMLRAGDAVVLSLRHTPSQLSKRILDFSFGVASALDATVDCIADKVFAITRTNNLDDDELHRLRSQGVI